MCFGFSFDDYEDLEIPVDSADISPAESDLPDDVMNAVEDAINLYETE